MATITQQSIYEGNPPWLFGLVADPSNGTPATISDIASIQLKVFKVGSPITVRVQVGATTDLTPADVMVNSPVTSDLRYTEDGGYNFKYQVSGDHFPNGNTKYVVEVEFTPTSGSPFVVVWPFKTINTYFHDTVDADA
jgi:hypothetical protein